MLDVSSVHDLDIVVMPTNLAGCFDLVLTLTLRFCLLLDLASLHCDASTRGRRSSRRLASRTCIWTLL